MSELRSELLDQFTTTVDDDRFLEQFDATIEDVGLDDALTAYMLRHMIRQWLRTPHPQQTVPVENEEE